MAFFASCHNEIFKDDAEKVMVQFKISGNKSLIPDQQMKSSVQSNDLILLRILKDSEFVAFGRWTGNATIDSIELDAGQSYTFETCVIKDRNQLKQEGETFWRMTKLLGGTSMVYESSLNNKWKTGEATSEYDVHQCSGGRRDALAR